MRFPAKPVFRTGAWLVVALAAVLPARAGLVTTIVEFVTPTSGSQNQLTVQGKIDTLARGLREVDAGITTVGVAGLLRAEVTYDTYWESPLEVSDIEFLDSSFSQTGVELFYDLPNTTRRITFAATGLEFALQFSDQGPPDDDQQLLTTGPVIPANSYQMVQNTGTAEVGITNRPSQQQNLAQQSVLSTYDSTQPIGQASLAMLPPPDGSDEWLLELRLPLSHQQLLYTHLGLPVTLDYSGTLTLVGALPPITSQVPEPGTLVFIGAAAGWLLLGRRRTVR